MLFVKTLSKSGCKKGDRNSIPCCCPTVSKGKHMTSGITYNLSNLDKASKKLSEFETVLSSKSIDCNVLTKLEISSDLYSHDPTS